MAMSHCKKLSAALLVAVLTASSSGMIVSNSTSASAQESTTTATVGKAAPDFTLPDASGKSRKLSDWKGKFVVLEWFNHGCPFVKKHYESGNMQKLQKEYTKKGVVWLAINSSAKGKQGNASGPDHKKKFKELKSAPSAVLLDEDGKVGHLYGAKTTPHMFVIDSKGVLVYAGAIDDKPSPDQNEIKEATNYVKAALDAAMSGKQITMAATKAYGCSVKYSTN